VSNEELLLDIVTTWVARTSPGDIETSRTAAAVALSAYSAGASVSESCREARRFLGCRANHPSRPGIPAGRGSLSALR
jgi:hypothetical protein